MRFADSLNITVSKTKLLDVLRSNMSAHVSTFEIARKEYLERCKKCMKETIKDIEEGMYNDSNKLQEVLYFSLPAPTSYESAYTEVISMLEFCDDEEVEITGNQYRAWVKDEWDWTGTFIASTMNYVR